MFYINKEENIFPQEVFDRLTDERKIGFIQITDEEHSILLNKLNEEQKTFTLEDGEIIYSDIKISASETLNSEKSSLQSYLNDTDYMATKCYERELSMKVEYPEEYVKRQEARYRIDEIRLILENL